MTLANIPLNKHVVLDGISWDLYQQLLREIGDGHTRLTYDQGRLEIMSPSGFHELVKTILGRLIEAYCDALDIDLEGFGSTTFDRETLQKGVEPDECYYIANARKMIGRQEFDREIAPPPDLAIEVEISPPGVERQPIYAALGVPEIWRYDGRVVTPLHRVKGRKGARYEAAEKSLAFPDLPMTELNRFLQIGLQKGQSAAARALRAWLRTR